MELGFLVVVVVLKLFSQPSVKHCWIRFKITGGFWVSGRENVSRFKEGSESSFVLSLPHLKLN